jgi:hypothetical protein
MPLQTRYGRAVAARGGKPLLVDRELDAVGLRPPAAALRRNPRPRRSRLGFVPLTEERLDLMLPKQRMWV